MGFKDHIDAVSLHVRDDIGQAAASFSKAYEQGHYKELAFKGAGVTVGALLGAKGVQQFVKGINERVPATQDPTSTQMNYTRMFVGTLTSFFGAAALYLAACRSIPIAR